jgi:GMP synthase PP-ATPase subunit
MTLDDLSQPEQVVLLALVGLMARMDGTVSQDELELLEQIADEIGEQRFEAARDAAAALDDGAAILQAAKSVERGEAREVIFELVYSIAVRDTIAESEAAMLNELAALWGLPQRVGESG